MLAYFDQNLWDSTLPSESYRSELKGKKLLLINVGGRYKYHVMKRIHALGVGHIVVLDTPNDWYTPFVDNVISGDAVTPLDIAHPEDDVRIQSILSYMKEHSMEFDGIWTFADASVVLTAQIAHFFGKPGLPALNTLELKNKQTLRKWLYDNRKIIEQGALHLVTLPCLSPEHIVATNFPLILKGKESFGKSLIHVVENEQEFHKFIELYGADKITLEPYFEGTDLDFNVIVRDGKIQWQGFIEDLPALQPGFLESGASVPYLLTEEEQREMFIYMQNILDISGIQTAFLHTEFRISRREGSFSFTLIEINFRMGGCVNFSYHLSHDGHDIIRSNIELALNMPLSQIHLPQHSGEYYHVKTENIYSHKSGILRDVIAPKNTKNIIECLLYAPIGFDCTFPPGPNDDLGWLVVGSRTSQDEASLMLERALEETVIDIA